MTAILSWPQCVNDLLFLLRHLILWCVLRCIEDYINIDLRRNAVDEYFSIKNLIIVA